MIFVRESNEGVGKLLWNDLEIEWAKLDEVYPQYTVFKLEGDDVEKFCKTSDFKLFLRDFPDVHVEWK